MTNDPFRHHPGLAPLVTPPEDSALREITPALVREQVRENDLNPDFVIPDEVRDACRARAMAGRWDQDLWVFAYGSLMWDPAVLFEELRRAHAPGVERRFILMDINGARGMPDRPGVMAALDLGDGCDGLVFRIRRDMLEAETRRLWNRERVGAAYQPVFIPVETAQGPIEALTFLADHDTDAIVADLPHEEQVRLCATGEGVLGTSRDYLEALARGLVALGVDDPHVTSFLADVRAYRG
ncbi:gamma-glutamylcyclotransferase [Ponticoccus sp. SC2-23]|uniref:gamma-glutamylcyclotransferase n=1 Tax=Alexandriicola marinus TaxID=2081710 RepID=UPI000FD70646|nr:gamma-glutamylcyclotransferase [Alexandriicola marinus]MBM1222100.1 gamma-glutamylcyclotransferase [Ponticoccus sp. SC6-9]MBM1226787.1 gamma-glutamylcyclotransferase [Ponticoccus sp. SC6-15]MBM1231047.1 gamma-glutamylcyclotransferase [Ponticoccus sp. SC6-38]MBM1235701.1 gamma-glutamylcyclotransferase [Ponticoccus sp. SC6-45]MBM1240069.1 gamma-glutamylcyclotransferase [Ponticoccus sp. SC6-49]MBM1244423.1 gamma-glutamylcyclotransferase [Ponticoccus sp. SC2-64]MBM1249175.1 gamma-glutamylcycl